MNLLRVILRHLDYHRETYVFPLLSVLLTLGALAGVPLLTGREVIDDPGALVGACYNVVKIALVAALVGLVQTHLVGYRSHRASGQPPASLSDDLFDLCATVFFFLLFSYLLWH